MGRVCLPYHQILPKCPQLYWSTKGFHHLDASILESRVRQTCLWDPAMTDLAQRITLTQPSINPAFPPHNSVRVDSGGFSFWCPSQEVAHQGDIPQQVDIPTTGFLHKGEALQSRACLSQRQHSLSDLPSAMLYQASFALMNASRHDRCIWIDARVSLARATLGILHKRKKYSGAHLRHCNSLRSCRWIYIYIYIFFPVMWGKSQQLQKPSYYCKENCVVSQWAHQFHQKQSINVTFSQDVPTPSASLLPSIKGPWLELWPVVWWTGNAHFL